MNVPGEIVLDHNFDNVDFAFANGADGANTFFYLLAVADEDENMSPEPNTCFTLLRTVQPLFHLRICMVGRQIGEKQSVIRTASCSMHLVDPQHLCATYASTPCIHC